MIVKLKNYFSKNVEMVLLMLATFFNPFGFDALFALVMKLTGSFWVTDAIFYAVSLTLFVIYFQVKKRNAKKKKGDQ